MRQAVIARHGAPDVFEMRESPDPIPGEGEVRIRVRAAGVNFADVLARIGLYPDAPKPPWSSATSRWRRRCRRGGGVLQARGIGSSR